MRSYIFLAATVMALFASCTNGVPGLTSNGKQPDTSVNFLKLHTPSATPDSIKNAIKDNVVILSNRDETLFCIAYQDPAEPLGSFIGFKLLGMSTEVFDQPHMRLNTDKFVTESGVSMGQTLEQILEKKGNDYIQTGANGDISYYYLDASEDFVKRHKARYAFEIKTMDTYVSSIRFGFVPSEQPGSGSVEIQKIDK